MVSSLKDALLGAGLKAPEPQPKPSRPEQRNHKAAPNHRAPKKGAKKRPPKLDPKALQSDENLSLAAAYKARTAQEQRERDLAKRKKEAEAKARRERIAKVQALIEGQTLNDDKAEESRYFEYSHKIRRVYVTENQQQALNVGELGVVQSKGTYHIVSAQIARQVRDVAPEYLALLQEDEPDPDVETVSEPGKESA